MLASARRGSAMSQAELARRVGTSRETISAYEHGRKSPTLHTLVRLLGAMGQELVVEPRVEFTERRSRRSRPIAVPSRLPRLPIEHAMAVVGLPIHLDWSTVDRRYDLADRRQRARVYEIVLREGRPDDVMRYIDGALLLDLWGELVLPHDVRSAWAPVISRALAAA